MKLFLDEPPCSLPSDEWLKTEGFTTTQINFQMRDLFKNSKNEQSFIDRAFKKSESEKKIPKISVDDFYEKKSLTAYQMIQKVSEKTSRIGLNFENFSYLGRFFNFLKLLEFDLNMKNIEILGVQFTDLINFY